MPLVIALASLLGVEIARAVIGARNSVLTWRVRLGVDYTLRERILARLTFPGALYLAFVAALPTILINQTSANFFFGGTSILIVIGVALDTMKQLEAQLMMRNYEGFLK